MALHTKASDAVSLYQRIQIVQSSTTNVMDEQTMGGKLRMRLMKPALALLVFAPLIGEILLGSTPFSRLYLFPSEIFLYGSGALFIRELAQKYALGWSRIVLLGICYALIEEGIADQSLFNPHFPGAGSLLLYGRWLGVNWYWAEYLIGWHAIWSITLPILLVSLLFPKQQQISWLGPGGLQTVGTIFIAACLSTFIIYFFVSGGFFAPLYLIGTALLVGALISLAVRLPSKGSVARQDAGQQSKSSVGLRWSMGLLAFSAGLVWLGNHEYLVPAVPALLLVLALLLLGMGVALLIQLISRWAASRSRWGDQQRLALASGGLFAGAIAGLKIVQDGKLVDFIFQVILCGATAAFLIIFNVRAHKQRAW